MRRSALLLAALLLDACVGRDAFPAPAAPPAPAAAAMAGYLPRDLLTRLGEATPASPAAGSEAEAADRAASAELAALADTPRWTLAQTHAEIAPALAVAHFDCPLDTRLSQEPPPALVRLLGRALRDAGFAANVAKERVFRARPFVDDPDRQVCIRVDADLAGNSSHPSGHAVAGTLFGEIMAEVAPDAAGEMRRRGREIGWSRAVCALHYPADVAAGHALGLELHRAMRDSAEYRADVAAARDEVAAARRLGRTNPGCASERAALALAAAPF